MATLISIAYPFVKGTTAFPKVATDDEVIQASIIQIMMTPKFTRIMRPTFGSNIIRFLFESNSDATSNGIETELRSALAQWEPRIRVSNIQVTTDEVTEPGQTLVTVNYVIIATGQPGSVTVAT